MRRLEVNRVRKLLRMVLTADENAIVRLDARATEAMDILRGAFAIGGFGIGSRLLLFKNLINSERADQIPATLTVKIIPTAAVVAPE